MASQDFRGGVNQIVMALEFEQPRDFANDKILRPNAKARSKLKVISRAQEWSKVKPAEDPGVDLRLANAGGNILARHGIGHADELSCDGAGAPFRGQKNGVRHRPLKRTDFGASLAKNFGQPRQRDQVEQRVNGTHQGRNERQHFRIVFENRLQRTLGTGGRPGNKADFNPGFFSESKNRRRRIFLRATYDQPGNDVGNPHPVFLDYWLSSVCSLFCTTEYSGVSSGAAFK